MAAETKREQVGGTNPGVSAADAVAVTGDFEGLSRASNGQSGV